MPYWPREQMLRKFTSKDFLSDERRFKNERFIHSDYEWKGNVIEGIELEMHSVELTVGKERGNCEVLAIWFHKVFANT